MAKPPEQVSGDRRAHKPFWLDLRRTGRGLQAMLYGGMASLVSLIITFWTLPQISSDGRLPILRLVVLLAVFGVLMRWVLAGVAILIGSVGVLVGGLLSQFGVVYLGVTADPGVNLHGGPEAVLVVSIVMSSVSVFVGWVAYAGSDDAYVAELMRVVRRRARKMAAAPKTGMLIIQIDGLSAPLLNWMVMSGNLPHLGGWIRDGKHSMVEWHTGVPATTPASQAGILHGGSGQIPAFRWYEKETGRVMVTNRGRDAAEIEGRMSTGRGLLADGGVSISNNWSGDAEHCELVFSRASLPNSRSRGYVRFFSSPQGAARGLVLCAGEMIKELFQARKQRRRNLVPRVNRGGGYIFLRAITNVLLRDLNVSLITDELVKGTPVIYCDFVDYDEVAHHAGPTRPESLQTLEGLDRVLGALQRIIDILPHSYEIVVLSDHGQSQGATFLQRYGRTLTEVVDELVDTTSEPVAAVGKSEGWGPVNAFLTELALRGSVAGSVTRKALHVKDGEVELGPKDCEPPVSSDQQMLVTASGNLALIYLASTPGRVPLEEIELQHPKLIPGLATHPGIGFVVVDSLAEGPVAIGRAGVRVLKSGRVEGEDPLARYGPYAPASILRQAELPHNGDVVVVSRVDDYTREVAAFEELVGCHGGIGGWQTEAVLVHPARWELKETPVGSDAIHALLISWLEKLGQRKDIEQPVETKVEA